VAHDGPAQQLRIDQLADAPAGRGGIIGDHGQIAFALTHDLVDEPLGRTHGHEAADHQARAVGDHCRRLIEGEGSHASCSFSRGLTPGVADAFDRSIPPTPSKPLLR
jgi:hypothetical protein